MSKEQKQLSLSKIISEIYRIREEFGFKKINIDIVNVSYKNGILTIYTKTRSDKSAIIGKGLVVGKLRERLNVKVVKVEDYTDILLFKKRCKLIKEKYKNFDVIVDICNYFLDNRKSNKKVYVTITCQKDLIIFKTLKNIFSKVTAILFDFNPLTPERVRNNIINEINKDKIQYNCIKINLNINKILEKYPCGFLIDYIPFEGVIFTSCLSKEVVLKENKLFINFNKLFPIKGPTLGYCPILIQYLKKSNDYKNLIKNVVEDIYKGGKEPTEGVNDIIKIIKKL